MMLGNLNKAYYLNRAIEQNLKEIKSDLNFREDIVLYLVSLKQSEVRAIMNGISSILLAVPVNPEGLLKNPNPQEKKEA